MKSRNIIENLVLLTFLLLLYIGLLTCENRMMTKTILERPHTTLTQEEHDECLDLLRYGLLNREED